MTVGRAAVEGRRRWFKDWPPLTALTLSMSGRRRGGPAGEVSPAGASSSSSSSSSSFANEQNGVARAADSRPLQWRGVHQTINTPTTPSPIIQYVLIFNQSSKGRWRFSQRPWQRQTSVTALTQKRHCRRHRIAKKTMNNRRRCDELALPQTTTFDLINKRQKRAKRNGN